MKYLILSLITFLRKRSIQTLDKFHFQWILPLRFQSQHYLHASSLRSHQQLLATIRPKNIPRNWNRKIFGYPLERVTCQKCEIPNGLWFDLWCLHDMSATHKIYYSLKPNAVFSWLSSEGSQRPLRPPPPSFPFPSGALTNKSKCKDQRRIRNTECTHFQSLNQLSHKSTPSWLVTDIICPNACQPVKIG